MRKAVVALVLSALVAGVVSLAPNRCEAQATTMVTPVSAFPQGTIGGGLLGAELVVMIQGIAGLRPRWAYIVFPLIGMAGGAIGGFFVDQAIDGAMPPSNGATLGATAMLVAGLGLIIPSALLYANATQFRPDERDTQRAEEDQGGTELEESREGTGSSTTTTTTTGGGSSSGSSTPSGGGGTRSGSRWRAPEALLQYTPGRFGLGIPMLSVVGSYSLQEMRQYGVSQQTEYRVPLFSATF